MLGVGSLKYDGRDRNRPSVEEKIHDNYTSYEAGWK